MERDYIVIPELISAIKMSWDEYIMRRLKDDGIYDLVPSQISILLELYKHEWCVPLIRLVDNLELKRTTLSEAVIRLEKLKYVERKKAVKDKRAQVVIATEKTKKIADQLAIIIADSVDYMLTPLTDADSHGLLVLIKTVRDHYKK